MVPALAQQSVQTRVYDASGNVLQSPAYAVSQSGKTTTRTEQRRSLDGRLVPAETTEERVISDDGQTRVVERSIRRYDISGNPAPPEKVRVEEQKTADGGTVTRSTTWRGDISGNLALAERSVIERRKSGQTETVNETVERPSINGSIDVAERRATTINSTGPDESLKNVLVYRRDTNGSFYESQKEVTETRKTAAGTVENSVSYQGGASGFQLIDQKVKRVEKAADGTVHVIEDVYRPNGPGVVNADAKPLLSEQRVTVRKEAAGRVTETTDVRRTSVADPNRLGAPQRESERVCSGKCP